jgi:MscS family membrane protein
MVSGMIAAAITVAAGIIIALAVHLIIRWLKRKAESTESKIDDILVLAVGKPLVVTILVVSVYIALTRFEVVPPEFTWLLDPRYINSVYILIGAWVVSTFLYNFIRLYGRWFAEQTESEVDDRIIDLLLLAVRYVIWFVAFILILYNLKIDITPFLAGAGIAGLAFALAAQDILSNFFGGAIISLDKPFKPGDRIQIENYLGDVVSVGPRSTRIRTLDNQLVTIPNSKITSSIVINYAMPDVRSKVRIPVSVAYGTNVAHVKEILLSIAREQAAVHPFILLDPAPSVYFLEFGESSENFQLIVWTNDYSLSWETQDAVNTRIEERFREEGIEIPFRQLDVRMRG